MQKAITIILLTIAPIICWAQTEKQTVVETENATLIEPTTATPSTLLSPETAESVRPEIQKDSIHYFPRIPRYMMYSPTLFTTWMPMGPLAYGGYWDMHEGLNAQIGMGVMVGFGKNNPFKGASFYTDVSLAYAKQIDGHWSIALGGTLSRFRMWNENQWAGDVFALANYKFDEHWSASLYASYNHVPQGMGMYDMYDVMRFNENFARFGGEVTYKFNEKFSIGVGISAEVPTDSPRPWQPQRPNQQRLYTPVVK